MNFNFKMLITGFLFLFIQIVISSCGNTNAAREEDLKDGAKAEIKKVNVRTKTVIPSLFTTDLELVGEVESEKDAVLSGQTSAILKRIFARKGTIVQEGDTILVLDDRRSRAFYEMALARKENTKIDFDIAKKQHDDGLGISDTQFKKAENGLLAANADLNNAEVELANCYLTAPFRGEVAERYLELGELANPGSPLIRLVDTSTLRIKSGVPENQSALIQKGAMAKVKGPDFNVKLEGKVSWVGVTLDPRSRTLPIEVSIKATRYLTPGMVIQIKVEKSRKSDAMVVPLSIVQHDADHAFLFLHQDGFAIYRQVEIGEISHDQAMIKSGLKSGDELIIDGYRDLVDGQIVNVVEKVEG